MIGMCFAVSVMILLCFLASGYSLPVKFCVKQFFPVTLGNLWFLTCYLLYYAIHPALNLVINAVDKRTLLLTNSVLIVLYCVISYVMGGYLFYYNALIGFVVIYFVVAYVKKYLRNMVLSKKFSVCILGIGIAGWILMFLTGSDESHNTM